MTHPGGTPIHARSGVVALEFPIICLITDRHLVGEHALVDAIEAAVDGGVTMVQLREKDLPTRSLLALAERIRERLAGRACLLVNGRSDIAAAARLDGVHLPQDGLASRDARGIVGARVLVGRSIHEAPSLQADLDGLDYLELGTVFPSRSHPGGRVIGLEEVTAAARGALPVLGVGGVTAANVADVIRAGAAGVAVISAILGDLHPERAARRLVSATHEAWAGRGAAALQGAQP